MTFKWNLVKKTFSKNLRKKSLVRWAGRQKTFQVRIVFTQTFTTGGCLTVEKLVDLQEYVRVLWMSVKFYNFRQNPKFRVETLHVFGSWTASLKPVVQQRAATDACVTHGRLLLYMHIQEDVCKRLRHVTRRTQPRAQLAGFNIPDRRGKLEVVIETFFPSSGEFCPRYSIYVCLSLYLYVSISLYHYVSISLYL